MAMKKIRISFLHALLVLALVLSLIPTAAFAAGASLKSSKSTLRAGDSFTLTYSVNGTDVQGLQFSLKYDSTNLTYSGHKFKISGWSSSANGTNFTTYDGSGSGFTGTKAIVAFTFKVKSGVATGTGLSASVSCTGTNSAGSSMSLSASWSGKVAAPLSGDATLKALSCSNASINFTGNSEYRVTVPYEVSSLKLSATPNHSGAKVSVSGNKLGVGSNTVTITVTAENGATKRYYIYATREQDPNYVPSSDAAISALSPSSGRLSPAFQADITDYVLYLPYEVTELTFNATANDSKARGVSQLREILSVVEELPQDEAADNAASEPAAPDTGTEEPAEPVYTVLPDGEPLPEGETRYTVTCTAEDGTTTKDYVIHVIRMPQYEGVLPEIIAPITEPVEPEPEPEPTTYDISLPLVLTLPYVGEVTLQQAAQGAVIALGVLLLLLLLIAWLIGRRGGRRKAMRKMAKQAAAAAAAETAAPVEEVVAATVLAEDAPAQEAPSAEEEPTEEVPAEEPAPDEEPAPAEESAEAGEAPAETEAAPTEEPAMSLDDILDDIRKM